MTSDSNTTTHTLDVPGARLYYERWGTGPVLAMIGSPMDSTGFAGLAAALADRYTVVTYDPRGIGNSSREDADADVTPQQQADDVHRLLSALGGGPTHVFGSSGGAVVGLALITSYPDQVSTLVAHEPPIIGLLPDQGRVRDQFTDVYDTYLAEGPEQAMGKFAVHTGLRAPGPANRQPQPPPEQIDRMRAVTSHFLAHLLLPTIDYQPDIAALRASPTRIVVAAGTTSTGQLAHRTAEALAGQLGTPLVLFPGDHGGFAALPEQFAPLLDRCITGSAQS